MKLIGISFILLGCTVSGFIIDGWERKRIKELENFIYIFELLKRDIDYQLTPLREACKAVIRFASRDVGKVFGNFEKQMAEKTSWNIEEMWQNAIEEEKQNLYLKEEDYSVLNGFGKACGYLDKEMQEKNIEMVIASLKARTLDAKQHYDKNTKLNKYLGFFIGACISIFLI
nr:stage III sporulation protein AB [uncultured Cellulosilyticum sp.]